MGTLGKKISCVSWCEGVLFGGYDFVLISRRSCTDYDRNRAVLGVFSLKEPDSGLSKPTPPVSG